LIIKGDPLYLFCSLCPYFLIQILKKVSLKERMMENNKTLLLDDIWLMFVKGIWSSREEEP